MPNIFGINGAQSQKQTKFAPIYNPRWSSGIWTNRSPLRDATTTRITEKYYGPAGDALIAGSNVEITNRLTLARRPGNSVYDSNAYSSVNRFEEFRLFNPTTEQINVMVDQVNALYSLHGGVKSLVFAKSTGSGQTYMQSVGNSLYFADGIDNKKWMQTLVTWTASKTWGTADSPFLTTFFIDSIGNIQQLRGTIFPITLVQVSGNVLTVTSSATLTSLLSEGIDITFTSGMAAAFLDGTTVTITGVTTNTFTADLVNPNYGPTAESSIGTAIAAGTPTSGTTQPTWSVVQPAASNNYQGGVTSDGSVQWVNRGATVKNWGIVGGSQPVTPVVGSTFGDAWQKFTYYSLAGVVIDSNGNLQQVTAAGQSGASTPTWKTTVGQTTTDGTVSWKMIQTAASLTWQADTAYTPSLLLTSVAAASGGSTVYTGSIAGGDANGLAGHTFLVSGFQNDVNNGSFACTASTVSSLTLSNASGVAETFNGLAAQQGTLQYVVATATGQPCLFQVSPLSNPTLQGNVSAYLYNNVTSGAVGCFNLTNPTSIGSAIASDTTLNSLSFAGTPLSSGANLVWNTVNGAGEIVGSVTPFPGHTKDYQLIILATLNVPVPGQYAFKIKHHDGMFWGIGGGATLISGSGFNPIGQTATAANGYVSFGGTNVGLEGGAVSTDTFVVNFPTAGSYPLEIDYAYWFHSGQVLDVQCSGNELANGAPQSGATQPTWPAWTTTNAPGYPSVTETGGALAWQNLGPAVDYTWQPTIGFTLPNTAIIDSNGNVEAPYRTGVTGSKAPNWAVGTTSLTLDNPNLIWINEGGATSVPSGTISTFNGGWGYAVSLVNTLDDTVSNASPVSAATGSFVGAQGVTLAPGAGLPAKAKIDSQSDFVAIFRTTDGQATPFLIPGPNSILGTLPLSTYLQNGFTDTVPDTGLNNLISAPIAQENTPPAGGAKNLTYYLDRIFYSIGNVVYWTSGSDTPAGNGVNGTSPLNFASFPSLVKRIVPTTSGALVFTVSDVYIVQGNGTVGNPIQSGLPFLPGVGLLSYNALDLNGAVIGFVTTDSQFVLIDPSAGFTHASFPLADQFALNNGTPGQSWNPANVYVAWYTSGADSGWFVADGANGWFRMLPTPAPETGYTWCPFATIVGGVRTVQSIEVTPGVHKLLLGPTNTGPILARDVNYFQDNGTSYAADAVLGSCVLAQPGQEALVQFITTECVNVGNPLTLGVLIDEALPYYKEPFETLTNWTNDPPNLKESTSIKSQRFYLSELETEAAVCRHMQIKVQWVADSVQNELLSLTIFGGFSQEG